MSEYHRHTSGDVIQGAAVRCIDPEAGAHDVVVMAQEELRALIADTMRDAAQIAGTYETPQAAAKGLAAMADVLAQVPTTPAPTPAHPSEEADRG